MNGITKSVGGIPKHFHGFGFLSLVFVLMVETAKKETIEAHLGENGSLLAWMTERIDLPCNSWTTALAEGLIQIPFRKGLIILDEKKNGLVL